MDKELEYEKAYLDYCKEVIESNINKYEYDIRENREQIKETFYEIHEGNVELYNQVPIYQSIGENLELQLKKNRKAYSSPYFGRIDYADLSNNIKEKIYIGKQGIVENNTNIIVVDWRAPIASVYYEHRMEELEFEVQDGSSTKVNLSLKRTFDIENGELLGFFDSDIMVNDELLIKYLSKNKKVVLDDIIATIQQEQNMIIREEPYRNIVVQGGAGSGKTSVALHKIAYILYNFSEKVSAKDFCIIGSNEKLLNYIETGLPELDICNITLNRMDVFLTSLLGKKWKKRYKISDLSSIKAIKCDVNFVKELDSYLNDIMQIWLPMNTIIDNSLGCLAKKESNYKLIKDLDNCSYNQIIEIFADRLNIKISSKSDQNVDLRKKKLSEYKDYYLKKMYKGNLTDIYISFLEKYEYVHNINMQQDIKLIESGNMDIYDIAALLLIYYRIARNSEMEVFKFLFIDEAQDFGTAIYYVLKNVLKGCYLNIIGDTSQNINGLLGLDRWEDITSIILSEDKDQFYCLSKSYRNTIEISNFAGEILERIGEKNRIEPVIRHGEEVEIVNSISWQEGIAKVEECIELLQNKDYSTIAVICFSEEESQYVKMKLAKRSLICQEQINISVLTVEETKGLEFDSVILWKPNLFFENCNIHYAKRIYVAITRALHKLYLIC